MIKLLPCSKSANDGGSIIIANTKTNDIKGAITSNKQRVLVNWLQVSLRLSADQKQSAGAVHDQFDFFQLIQTGNAVHTKCHIFTSNFNVKKKNVEFHTSC